MNFKCSYTELVDTETLIPSDNNPNTHTSDQLQRLSELIAYQGQRAPIIISKRSGKIVVGHGRWEAIKRLGWEQVAVDYQDFDTEEQEYAHLTADNAIAEWSVLDFSKINKDFLDMGPELDISMLGLENFDIQPAHSVADVNSADESAEWARMPDMPEFEVAANYISINIHFSDEAKREEWAEHHELEITKKMKNNWICHV